MAVAVQTAPGQAKKDQRIPGRGLFFGSLVAIVVNLVAPYSEWIVKSTLMTTNYFPLGLAFTFLVVVCFINPMLKVIRPAAGLSEADLAVIYMMLLAAVSVPTYGITGYVLSVSASAFYFANPENGWADFLHQQIPTWAVPKPGRKLDWFFEGLPPGESVPWEIWIVPLFWWGTLIVATLALSTSLIALFRSQWIDNERLSFPLVSVPSAMIEGSSRGRILPSFLDSKLFWSGFSVSFLKVAWEIPSYFYPQWPRFGRIRLRIKRGKIFPGISSTLTLPLLGLSYFVNTDVLLSVWAFNLLNIAEIALFNQIGFTIGATEIYSVNPPSLAWQGFGAFSALVFGGVWVAREHLARVWRKAWSGDPDIDDSHELMSYRTSVVTIVASIAFILLWLNAVGISFTVSLLLVYAVITLYLGLTRIVIEGGLVFVRGPLLPQAFAMHTIGPGSLGPDTMTGLALSYAWACDPIANFMPFGANAARIHTDHGLPRSSYVTAMALGLGISLVVSFLFSLKLAYTTGGYNFGDWIFGRGGQVPFDTIVAKIKAGQGVQPWYYIFFGIGIVATTLLTYLRHRLPWWRLHPLGFSIASVGQVQWTMFTLFVAWLAKRILIRTGGLMLYNRGKPFFIGLTLGHFAAAGLSFFIDIFWFTGHGHSHYF
jgi:hypothetical protein